MLPDASLRSAYYRIRFRHVLVILWIAYTSYTMSRRPFSVARASIQEELDISTAHLSLVDTAFVMTYTVAQLSYGYLKRYMSYYGILLLGLGGALASCTMLALGSSVFTFVVAWGINGLAQGAGWASCMAIISLWVFPDERGAVMGVWSTNMAVGGVLGAILPSFLIGRGVSWRMATMITAAAGPGLALITTVLFLKKHPNQCGMPCVQQAETGITVEELQEVPKLSMTMDGEYVFARNPSDTMKGDVANASSTAPPTPTLTQIFFLRGMPEYCLSYFLHKLVRYAFLFWMPYYINKELHQSPEVSGYVSSAFDIGGAIGIVASGFASDYFFQGKRRILVLLFFTCGMAVSTTAMGLFSSLFAESIGLCCFVVFCVGFFSFAIDALQSGACLLGFAAATHAPVGAISGLVGGVGSLGSVMQGVCTVALASYSWGLLFISFGAATVVAGALMYRPLKMEIRSASA